MVLRKYWILILMVFIVFPLLLVRYLDRVPIRNYCDFRVYYKAGQDFIKGKDIYFRETGEITPYKYSPFFAFVFAPLTLLPIKASAAVFFAINFLSSLLFFWLSFHLVEDSAMGASFSGRDRFLVYVLAVLCSLGYVFLVLDSGQVNILMCILILAGLSFLSRGKPALAGAFFAASILIKYTPAIFLPYFLFQREFKFVFWSILFVGLFLILPAFVIGIDKNISYLSSWIPSIIATSLDKYSYVYSKNQSIFSLFLRFFSPTQYHVQLFSFGFDRVLKFGSLVALLMYSAVFISGKSKTGGRVIDFAILMVCMSLFNPNAWQLNFVSLLLAYMVLIQYLVLIKWRDMFVLFFLIAAFVLPNLMSKDIFGKRLENLGCMYSFTTFGALFIYFALLKLKFFQNDYNIDLKA